LDEKAIPLWKYTGCAEVRVEWYTKEKCAGVERVVEIRAQLKVLSLERNFTHVEVKLLV